MENVNLLHADQQDLNDEEDEHPFLTTRYNKQSFTDSPTFKGCVICIMTFMIAIFIGFIIGSNISPQQITQTQSLEFATKSPTQSPHINKKIYPQTPSPTTTTTSTTTSTTTTPKPTTTTTTTTSSTTSSTTSTTSTTSKTFIPPQEAIAFTTLHPLETNLENEELSKLETNMELIIVNEQNGMNVQKMKPVYGPVMVYYKYPNNPMLKYATNEIRRTCMSFQLNSTSIFEHAMIEIKFNRFELENGFDRVLIRHFNQSFIDLPLSYSGYQYNLSLQYVLERDTNKTLCIELQSDQSITDYGIDYTVSLYYDLCQWSQDNECFTMQLWGKRWDRGPFMNGKCGLGINSKHRLTTVIDDQHGNELEGFLHDCAENHHKMLQNDVEYCIKRKCEDYVNEKGPEFDAAQVPGQGWYNISRYYNGAGRLDPNFADPFRIYLATENNVFHDLNDVGWITKLTDKLTAKAKEISDQHQHVNILKYAILDAEHHNIAAEFIGAKVLDALINGTPFIVALTGDSVTSGHDNMFMSTYPMQLQSRLRKFFVENGNVGATFFTRNFALGGGPSSDSQGFMPVSMITETFPDSFSKLSAILDDNYDIWYRNGGYPIRKLDLVTSEFFYVEGRGTYSSRELHLRESAYLDAVWAVINPIKGVGKIKDACKSWQELNQTMMNFDWMRWDKQRWKFMKLEYLQAMGIVAMDPDFGMPASCPLYKAGTEQLDANSHHEDDGLRPDGEMFAYTPWWFRVNWHPNSRGHRVMSDVISFWIINSAADFANKYKDALATFNDMDSLNAFLKEKSGNWKQDILKSIMDKKYDEWVTPEFCGVRNIKDKDKKDAIQYNDFCESVPFALTNAKPMVYNTHNLLNEYVYDADGNGTVWNDYIKHAGWTWKTSNSIVSIVRKKGAEGNMDTFWMLKPDTNFFVNKFDEMYKNDNSELLQKFDKFHNYLIENRIYLQFVVKTPKYGSGRIKIFNGFNCNQYIQSVQLMKVYVNKVENINGDNGELQLGKEITSEECIIVDLELDTKYVVSYVPYNITAKTAGKGKAGFKDYNIMFLVAY